MVAGVCLGITTFVGVFVTTWMTGRIARMNPAAVFIALLFWGWLWGLLQNCWGTSLVVDLQVLQLNLVVNYHTVAATVFGAIQRCVRCCQQQR